MEKKRLIEVHNIVYKYTTLIPVTLIISFRMDRVDNLFVTVELGERRAHGIKVTGNSREFEGKYFIMQNV